MIEGGRGQARVVERAGGDPECTPRWAEYYCPRDGKRYNRREKCDRERLCAYCSYGWAYREARVVEDRLKGVARKHGLRRNVRHVVVSYGDPEWWDGSPEAYDATFRRAWEELKRMGSLGGALVVHPWRHKPSEVGTLWWVGVHVHALVWGRVDEEQRTAGVFVRTLRSEQASNLATFAYLLDHCGIVERKHAVRWVGVASYNKSPGLAVPRRKPEGPFCPECGCLMERVLLIDWTDRGRPVALPAEVRAWAGS